MSEDLVRACHRAQARHRMPRGRLAGRAEDGDEDRESERPADLLGHVDHAGRRAGVLRPHPGQRGHGQRHERDAHSGAEQQHRAENALDVAGPRRDLGEPRHPGDDRQQPCDHRPLRPEPRDEPRRETRDGKQRAGHGHERDACLQRAETEDLLDVLGQEEEHPEHAGDQQQPGDVGTRTAAVGEQPQGRDRLRAAGLVHAERAEQCRRRSEGRQRQPVRPAIRCRPEEGVDERGHACRRGQRADDVEPARLARRLGQNPRSGQEHRGADGHVDEEDPAPRGPLRDHAAEHQAERGAAHHHGGEDAEGPGPFPFSWEIRR